MRHQLAKAGHQRGGAVDTRGQLLSSIAQRGDPVVKGCLQKNSMAPTVTSCTNSSPPQPTWVPTPGAAPSRTGSVLPPKPSTPLPPRSVLSALHCRSPGNPFNDMSETDACSVYIALTAALRPLGLAYLHVLGPRL
jgi:hypothetical protein